MKTVRTFLASLVMLCLLATLAVAADYVKVVNVKDAPYNAAGDGVTDDTLALRHAIYAAVTGDDPCYRVYLPPGNYLISSTLKTSDPEDQTYPIAVGQATNLHLFGAGREPYGSLYPITTQITWDGDDGEDMFDICATKGVNISDLTFDGDKDHDGSGKAGNIIEVTSIDGGHIAAQIELQRVTLTHATTGFLCSGTPNFCNSDMTFNSLRISYCETGFKAEGTQNLDYVFSRLEIGDCTTGLWFYRGGSVVVNGCYINACVTGIKCEYGEVNDSNYVFTNCRTDIPMWDATHRMTFLEAGGCANVNITSLSSTTAGYLTDKTTPWFKLHDYAKLSVDDSLIASFHYADLTGHSFLQFENCSFVGADPRGSIANGGAFDAISHEPYTGFEIRNGAFNGGMIPIYHILNCTETPLPPGNMTATVISTSQIDVAWDDKSDNETGFMIYYSTNGTDFSYLNAVGANTELYHATGLLHHTKYYFYVKARVIIAGNPTIFSADSNVADATTLNAPPTVSLILPDGDTYAEPARITLVATASDSDGTITKVEFYDGANKIGEDDDGQDGYSYVDENPTVGNHSYTAKAIDDDLAETVSTPAQSATVAFDSDLRGLWRLNDGTGTTAVDAVHGHNGTLTNGPTWTTGAWGGAVQFDGTNDQIYVADHTDLDPTDTDTITLACWAKSDGATWNSYAGPVSKAGSYRLMTFANSKSMGFYVWTDGGWNTDCNVTDATLATLFPGFAITDWHHYAGTYDGAHITLYVDGMPVKQVDETGELRDVTNPLYIGGYDNLSWLDGAIDDVRIYSRALSDTEIEDLASFHD